MIDRTAWGPAPSLDDIAAIDDATPYALDEPFLTHAATVANKVEHLAYD